MSSTTPTKMREFTELGGVTADEMWRKLLAHMFVCDNPHSSVELELNSSTDSDKMVNVKLDITIREIDGVPTILPNMEAK